METKGTGLCHCGQPLHYRNRRTEILMRRIVMALGEYIPVTVGRRTWNVQRHYIALHGIKGGEIHRLGFEEIAPRSLN